MACAKPPDLKRLQRRDRRTADQRGDHAPGQIGVIEPGRTDRNGYVQHRRRQYECGTLESDNQRGRWRTGLLGFKSNRLVAASGSQSPVPWPYKARGTCWRVLTLPSRNVPDWSGDARVALGARELSLQRGEGLNQLGGFKYAIAPADGDLCQHSRLHELIYCLACCLE